LLSRHKRLIHARKHDNDEQPGEALSSTFPISAAPATHAAEILPDDSPSIDSIELHLSNTAMNIPPNIPLLLEGRSLQLLQPSYSYEQTSPVPVANSSCEDVLPHAISIPINDPMQDFSAFIESIGLSLDWENEGFLSEYCLAPSGSNAPESELVVDGTQPCITGNSFGQPSRVDEASFSNFGSRLPSLQPESRSHGSDKKDTPHHIVRSLYKVSQDDHYRFLKGLEHVRDILPLNFHVPSRYALSCSIDGFVDGLNEHLPFIHAPTLSISNCSPALTLAIAACGSQYRFESTRGLAFFHASRALLLDELDKQKHHKLRTRSQQQMESCSRSEQQNVAGDSIETIQTLLLLTIFATWGNDSEILQDLLSLQGVLASMIRTHGLCESDTPLSIESDINYDCWRRWVRQECDRRTKLVAYTFHNLHSLMYNTAPLILNSDLKLNLPCPTILWKAGSGFEWQLARESSPRSAISFQNSFTLLFSRPPILPGSSSFSTPLGNHILMHAILQQIYFARQLYIYPPLKQLLRTEDLAVLEDVLRSWKLRWQQTPESSTNPRNPAGPIAFTSSALLGQAYVRLYLDLGPCRALMSLQPLQIAEALHGAPPIVRTPGLVMALLHAAHALSIPVRSGIDFVARTHSLYWSIQHSLSSLEYAFLLSRWLLTLPDIGPAGMSEHECLLFVWIKRIVEEAEPTEQPTSEGECTNLELVKDAVKMTQLACAIIRIWVRTFKGNACWGLVDLVGSSLEVYTTLLEEA
jgi:hypothetical protein